MSLSLRTIYFTLTGAIGALAAWFLMDVLLQFQPASPYLDALVNGAIIGICVGAAVNGFAGLMEFKVWPVVRGGLLGMAGGLLGGLAGLLLGEVFYEVLGTSSWLRIVGWMIFGMLLGVVDGLLARSGRRMLYAGLGGLLGGLFGGLAFYLLSRYAELSGAARAVGFTLLGGLTGLFVGLVPVMLRDAWLKVTSSGRNEGKERLVDRPRIVIGSDSRCDLPLYDDPAIAPRHAEIHHEKSQYVLKPLAGSIVIMGDQQVQSRVLQNEDIFQIGRETIIFRSVALSREQN